jgi:hypothetical protein
LAKQNKSRVGNAVIAFEVAVGVPENDNIQLIDVFWNAGTSTLID